MLMVNQLVGFGAFTQGSSLVYTTLSASNLPYDSTSVGTLSNGNLTAVVNSPSGACSVISILGTPKGYVESNYDSGSFFYFGLAKLSSTAHSWFHYQNGGAGIMVNSGGGAGAPASNYPTSGNTAMLAWDLSANKMWIGRVGAGWISGGDPAAGTSPTFAASGGVHGGTLDLTQALYPFCSGGGSNTQTWNFGATAFAGTPPTGFTGLGS